MNAEALAVGLIGIGAGSLLAMFGVRFFWILLALWGAIVGFLAGAEIAASLLGDGFLATLAGWAAGAVGAIALGLLAGVVYWAAVVVISGGIGFAVGSGVLLMLGVDPGLLTAAAGLALAAVLVGAAIVFRVPVVLVAVLTSLGGVGYAIVGGLLVLGRVGLADLQGGALGALADRPLAVVAWLGLGATACAYQLVVAREDEQRLLGPLDQGQDHSGGAA